MHSIGKAAKLLQIIRLFDKNLAGQHAHDVFIVGASDARIGLSDLPRAGEYPILKVPANPGKTRQAK